MIGTFLLLLVLSIRTSVRGAAAVEVVVEVVVVVTVVVVDAVVVVTRVVVVGHTYSRHGHPSGHPAWHGHNKRFSSYSLEHLAIQRRSPFGQLKTQAL